MKSSRTQSPQWQMKNLPVWWCVAVHSNSIEHAPTRIFFRCLMHILNKIRYFDGRSPTRSLSVFISYMVWFLVLQRIESSHDHTRKQIHGDHRLCACTVYTFFIPSPSKLHKKALLKPTKCNRDIKKNCVSARTKAKVENQFCVFFSVCFPCHVY